MSRARAEDLINFSFLERFLARPTMTFGTILVARSKDRPASPLEQSLRACSQRLRVVPRLSGEAHLVLKEETSTTLAVQVYDADRIEATERRWKEEAGRSGGGGGGSGGPGEDWMLTKKALAARKTKRFDPLSDDPTIVGLQTFRDTFRNTAVFVVLGTLHGDLRRRQMNRPTSFLNVAQRALASPRRSTAGGGSSSESSGGSGNDNGNGDIAMGSSRIFLVTGVASLQSHLRATIDSIRPDKIGMKEKFFAEQCQSNGLQASSSSGAEAPLDNKSGSAVAQRVADALRAWSDGAGIPRGEMDVVLGMLGSLEAVVAADGRALAGVPVSDRTKRMIVAFFSSSPLAMSSSSSAALVGRGVDEERQDGMAAVEEMERMGGSEMMGHHRPEQPNFSAGGWTAGDQNGMAFSGHVVGANTAGGDGGGVVLSEMQSFVGSGGSNQEGEGPRYQGNGANGGGMGAAGYAVGGKAGHPYYNSSNVWGGGQQQQPRFSGVVNPRDQSHHHHHHGWM